MRGAGCAHAPRRLHAARGERAARASLVRLVAGAPLSAPALRQPQRTPRCAL